MLKFRVLKWCFGNCLISDSLATRFVEEDPPKLRASFIAINSLDVEQQLSLRILAILHSMANKGRRKILNSPRHFKKKF